MDGVRFIAILWSQHHIGTVVLVWYGAFFLIPGVTMLVIPRWIEDGHVWAFSLVSCISVLAAPAILVNSIGSCFVSLGLILIPLRVLAAILNAWPDMRDVARDRRRRNRTQGFEPIIQLQAAQVTPPIPVLSPAQPDWRPLPTTAQRVQRPVPESRAQQGPILPRFVPDSLGKASRGIRGVGGVMLIPFVISVILGLSINADNQFGLSWLQIIGLPVVAFLLPGVVCLWIGSWIDIGRQWAVIVVGSTSCAAMIAGWTFFAITSQSITAGSAASEFYVCLFSSGLCGLVLVFCVYVWRDVCDVSRSMARDRLAAKRH